MEDLVRGNDDQAQPAQLYDPPICTSDFAPRQIRAIARQFLQNDRFKRIMRIFAVPTSAYRKQTRLNVSCGVSIFWFYRVTLETIIFVLETKIFAMRFGWHHRVISLVSKTRVIEKV